MRWVLTLPPPRCWLWENDLALRGASSFHSPLPTPGSGSAVSINTTGCDGCETVMGHPPPPTPPSGHFLRWRSLGSLPESQCCVLFNCLPSPRPNITSATEGKKCLLEFYIVSECCLHVLTFTCPYLLLHTYLSRHYRQPSNSWKLVYFKTIVAAKVVILRCK